MSWEERGVACAGQSHRGFEGVGARRGSSAAHDRTFARDRRPRPRGEDRRAPPTSTRRGSPSYAKKKTRPKALKTRRRPRTRSHAARAVTRDAASSRRRPAASARAARRPSPRVARRAVGVERDSAPPDAEMRAGSLRVRASRTRRIGPGSGPSRSARASRDDAASGAGETRAYARLGEGAHLRTCVGSAG